MSKNIVTEMYRNSSKYPIRFDRLNPGSYFKIDSERSRGMYKSTDDRLYQKSRDQFNAVRVSDQASIVLMPEDMVMPMVRSR